MAGHARPQSSCRRCCSGAACTMGMRSGIGARAGAARPRPVVDQHLAGTGQGVPRVSARGSGPRHTAPVGFCVRRWRDTMSGHRDDMGQTSGDSSHANTDRRGRIGPIDGEPRIRPRWRTERRGLPHQPKDRGLSLPSRRRRISGARGESRGDDARTQSNDTAGGKTRGRWSDLLHGAAGRDLYDYGEWAEELRGLLTRAPVGTLRTRLPHAHRQLRGSKRLRRRRSLVLVSQLKPAGYPSCMERFGLVYRCSDE